jgi:hypothetical protein
MNSNGSSSKIAKKAMESGNEQEETDDQPFLVPIEDPEDVVLKQVYAGQAEYPGKAITPTKVHSARLPPSFAQFYGRVSELDRELELPPEMVMLIRARVAQLNVCLFCMDSNGGGDDNALDEPGQVRSSRRI